MLLGNAHVDELAACLFALLGIKAHYHGSARGYGAYGLVRFHLLHKEVSGYCAVILTVSGEKGLACLGVKGHTPVPLLLVCHSGSVSSALFGNDVDYNRNCAVLNASERINKRGNVIAVLNENIVKTHCTEKIAFALSLGFSQQPEVFVDTAVIFGNGHIIVIYNDDEIALHLACKVETFHSLSAAE